MKAIRRLIRYYRRNGLASTYTRLKESLRRAAYGGRYFLYFCPLPLKESPDSSTIRVERTKSGTLSVTDHARIIEASVSPAKALEISERFAKGCELWLAKQEDLLCGFGWTIKADTVAAHFFPLDQDEVHLFDFYVFPEFRGRRVNIGLLTHILSALSAEGVRGAHLECAAWNTSQIHSLKKSPFRPYAVASKITLFAHVIVFWHTRAKTP
jgi:ribosomal protein S18 acetylase RimI-like enzyme